ncbi:hypothetical protein ANI02nite_27500 [Acetobacter nitrogenifigens DSM 23921 = NBRC 105050]|uniref:histidine kinase n=2 Tax=Acetobacter nitrogenifigens TaxID=285268 RepID=A0A511XD27_9PROT|nr:hypothetical protein ANI02nite_27500 [Acetobacter nitrogenifigens DSM 23921 = NBRC 105050]
MIEDDHPVVLPVTIILCADWRKDDMETPVEACGSVVFPGVLPTPPDLSQLILQKAMLDATPDCIKMISVSGRLLMMNRAGCLALGVAEDSGFGMPWIPLLPEDVHQSGLVALGRAASGENARFHGKSESAEGTKYWDNLLTPVMDSSGGVQFILCVSRDVTEKTILEWEVEESIKREKLLSKEMRHRVKNLFSVVSGLIVIAEKEAAAEDAPEDATCILREKLEALSRATDAAFADRSVADADVTVIGVHSLVNSVLRPYGSRCSVVGGDALLRNVMMTTLTLFLHELATNSVKYGALGSDGGQVTVRCVAENQSLDMTWLEVGGPKISTSPKSEGFGSEMIDRIVRSAGGTINRTWHSEGLVVDLCLPSAIQFQHLNS